MLASRSLMISRAAVLSPRVAFGKSALSAPIRAARITTTTPVARATAGGVNDPDAAKATLDVDPFAKSARLGRPMSPHLSIYKWEMTMVGSIAHRATGAGVAALFYFGSIWYGISPYHSADVVNLVHSLPNEALIAGKVILASPLNWDTGKALDVNSVFNTGYVVLAGTAVGTAYLALQ
ncbi:hypothetical protein PhCBS80983_g00390 [Powellomyces hirtus]|uniref:Uncharacterized protein n=1 Tax=Powellomyces hirtus TaxID=109895 RepID=A0A507EFR1_9FUNG|nr:hypothetical protein PhCBS80983_g00390 [Powellomyces hirtus]